MKLKFTFVVPVNDMIVAENNILASPLFSILEGKEILIQKNYSSASRAYNDAIDKAKSDIIIFVHQDIILPMKWSDELIQCLTLLESEDPNWGVLGCYGETEQGEGRGYLYCAGNNSYIGKYSRMPHKVQTLDEIILIIRKSYDFLIFIN